MSEGFNEHLEASLEELRLQLDEMLRQTPLSSLLKDRTHERAGRFPQQRREDALSVSEEDVRTLLSSLRVLSQMQNPQSPFAEKELPSKIAYILFRIFRVRKEEREGAAGKTRFIIGGLVRILRNAIARATRSSPEGTCAETRTEPTYDAAALESLLQHAHEGDTAAKKEVLRQLLIQPDALTNAQLALAIRVNMHLTPGVDVSPYPEAEAELRKRLRNGDSSYVRWFRRLGGISDEGKREGLYKLMTLPDVTPEELVMDVMEVPEFRRQAQERLLTHPNTRAENLVRAAHYCTEDPLSVQQAFLERDPDVHLCGWYLMEAHSIIERPNILDPIIERFFAFLRGNPSLLADAPSMGHDFRGYVVEQNPRQQLRHVTLDILASKREPHASRALHMLLALPLSRGEKLRLCEAAPERCAEMGATAVREIAQNVEIGRFQVEELEYVLKHLPEVAREHLVPAMLGSISTRGFSDCKEFVRLIQKYCPERAADIHVPDQGSVRDTLRKLE